MTPLDWVRIDTTGYAGPYEIEKDAMRGWVTPEQDEVRIVFIGMRPDLPEMAASVENIAAFYEAQVGDSGARLVETAIVLAGGMPAVCVILSVPQNPTGRTYVASLTIPFRDFSYVLKCQCPERGTTGMREALLADRKMAANEITFHEDNRYTIADWNPDDPAYDAEFSWHPVARVRKLMGRVVESLVMVDALRQQPGFTLPPPGEFRRRAADFTGMSIAVPRDEDPAPVPGRTDAADTVRIADVPPDTPPNFWTRVSRRFRKN